MKRKFKLAISCLKFVLHTEGLQQIVLLFHMSIYLLFKTKEELDNAKVGLVM